MTDRCEITDLRRGECAHCDAAPGTSFEFLRWRTVVRGAVLIEALEPAMPVAAGLQMSGVGHSTSETRCQACESPTRDNAYGCDACADRLRLTFADAPWWAEQIEISMTKQQAKRPGAGGGGTSRPWYTTTVDGVEVEESSVPWRDDAADLGHGLRNHLVTTVRLCLEDGVRHSSPYALPHGDFPSIEDLSTWLLWRVDGLTLHPAFGEILADAERFETLAEWLIDRRPDRVFLGRCRFAQVCGGVVYAKGGEQVAKCRACGEAYDVAERRAELEQALDDRLMTAAEIATCATYLGIPAERDVVRKRVNRWHNAEVIRPASWVIEDPAKPEERTPRFRYGDVAPKLAATYEKG